VRVEHHIRETVKKTVAVNSQLPRSQLRKEIAPDKCFGSWELGCLGVVGFFTPA
jgi:hypothetical protein